MRNRNKYLSLLLALILSVSLLPLPARADEDIIIEADNYNNFTLKREYHEGQFSDVGGSDWYGESVAIAYEFGLANGVGDRFGVNDTLSLAQALAFSCRLHKIYHKMWANFDESRGENWYNTYLGYGIPVGLIKDGEFGSFEAENMDRPATRAEYAELLSRAFPRDAFPVTLGTEKTSLPDVPAGSAHSGAILMLYNAGVVTGVDDAGHFSPDSPITRAAAVTIIARMAQPQSRIRPNAAEEASSAAISGEPVFVYLARTALANGAENASGSFRYDYAREFGDSTTASFFMFYCPELQNGLDYITLDVKFFEDDSDDSFLLRIYIPSDLHKPYPVYFYLNTKVQDESCVFLKYMFLNPWVFRDNEEEMLRFGDIEKREPDGDMSEDNLAEIQERMDKPVAAWLGMLLREVQEKLLSAGGYTLADLGFTRFGASGNDPEATGSSRDVYSFLRELVIENDKNSTGDYYYSYEPSSSYDGSNFTLRFYCYYLVEHDRVYAYCSSTFSSGNTYRCMVALDDDPGNKSHVSMSFTRKSDGERYVGHLYLDRTTFSGSGADPEFNSFDHDGDTEIKKMMRGNINTMARLALKVAEENLLTPNGYSLRDLGFLNLD